MTKAVRFKVYQLGEAYGAQVWYADGRSMRHEPFDTMEEASAWVFETYPYLRVEFHCAYQITRLVIFYVDYYTCGSNPHPYFATQALKYCRSKMDTTIGEQCQDSVLSGDAMRFWRKWHDRHLHDLTGEEYVTLLEDLDALGERYNSVVKRRDSFRNSRECISGLETYELSMMPLK